MHGLVELLQRLRDWVTPHALNLGAAGLALVAFLDSSFLSLPEVADALLLVLVTQHPERWIYYAAMTTAGSVIGCYVIYELAKKGGEAFLRRRFHERHVDRGLAAFRKYGVLAIIVPSLMPPPMPFKIFILLAGVAEVPTMTFLAAIAAGRGLRYGGEALLFYLYGDRAQAFLSAHFKTISYGLAGLVAVGGVIYALRRRRRAQ
jgi:membrane protein YqaA with SNARE-associated domain